VIGTKKKSNDDFQSHALNSRNQRVVDVKYLKNAEITLSEKYNIFTFRSRYLSFDFAHQFGIFFSKAKNKNQKYDFLSSFSIVV